jgi:hypothetical protein
MSKFIQMPLPTEGEVFVNVGRINYMRPSTVTPGTTALFFDREDFVVKITAQEIMERSTT